MSEGFPRKDHLLHGALEAHARAQAQKEAAENPPALGPITVYVGTPESLSEDAGRTIANLQAELINFRAPFNSRSRELNHTHGGNLSYVLSAISESNKCSSGYANCTGIALVGVDKETGKNISLFSHQDPRYFLRDAPGDFEVVLEKLLQEFVEKTENGTRDAVIFGGNYLKDYQSLLEDRPDRSKVDDYVDSVHLLSNVIRRVADLEARVVKPSMIGGETEAYFDTKNRKLYIICPEQPGLENDASFPA